MSLLTELLSCANSTEHRLHWNDEVVPRSSAHPLHPVMWGRSAEPLLDCIDINKSGIFAGRGLDLPLNICLGWRKVGKGWSCVGKMGLMWLCGLILEFPPLPELICQSVLFSRLSASMFGFTHIGWKCTRVILNQKKNPGFHAEFVWLNLAEVRNAWSQKVTSSAHEQLDYTSSSNDVTSAQSKALSDEEKCVTLRFRSDLLGLFCGLQIIPSGLSSCVLDSGPQGPR